MPKWIEFVEGQPCPRTRTWTVVTKQDGTLLGSIRWDGGFRKYVFRPYGQAIYDNVCLRDIAAFVEEQTRAHKNGMGK